jgi:hypothetical protein
MLLCCYVVMSLLVIDVWWVSSLLEQLDIFQVADSIEDIVLDQ